jgi:predicted Zn finger-like uncharacterized protein
MIITCEECTTRFNLDDARIPEAGAKVRCSKCKHAFFVKPPRSADDAVDNAVAEVLAGDHTDPAEFTSPGDSRSEQITSPGHAASEQIASPEDSASEQITSPGDSATALRAPDDQTAQEAIDEFDESDWEFNTDEAEPSSDEREGFEQPPGLDLADSEDAAESGDAADSGLGDTSGVNLGDTGGPEPDDASDEEFDHRVGLELGGGDVGETEPEADAATEAVDGLLGAADDEDDELFDTRPGAVEHGIDALLGGAEKEPGAAPRSEPIAQDPVDAALDEMGLENEALKAASPAPAAVPPSTAPAPPRAETEAAAPVPEELGEPGEWDFFAEGAEQERPAASGRSGTAPLVIGRIGATAPEPRSPVSVASDPSAAGGFTRRAANGVGWLATGVLAALIVHQALWVAPRISPVAASGQQLAGLEASSVEGRWLENRNGDSLFVVSGELRPAAGAMEPNSRLAVRLLDASGATLLDDAASVGPERPMRALREEDPETLRGYQADAARALALHASVNRRATPFAAVLDEVPNGAKRFELTTVRDERPRAAPSVEAEPGEQAPAEGDVTGAGSAAAGGVAELEAPAAGEPVDRAARRS